MKILFVAWRQWREKVEKTVDDAGYIFRMSGVTIQPYSFFKRCHRSNITIYVLY